MNKTIIGSGCDPVTVVVTGVTGAVGSAAARELFNTLGAKDKLVLLGRSAQRTAEVRNELVAEKAGAAKGGPEITTATLSLDFAVNGSPDSAVIEVLKGVLPVKSSQAVLINGVGPSSEVSEPLARAAIAVGMDFVDPGGSTRLLETLKWPAREHGRTVLLGAGVQPGLTGLMLARCAELTGEPGEAEVSMLVGGRQRLTTATLREYFNSLGQDGGWPGAIWEDSDIVPAKGHIEVSIPEFPVPRGATVSIHMDEEYAHVAASMGIRSLRAANVMDSPETVAVMRRWIAGEATDKEVAGASEADAVESESGSKAWFRIEVRADLTGEGPPRSVRSSMHCRDSYAVTGSVAAQAVLAVLGRADVAPVEIGASWASDSPAADRWAQRGDVEFYFDAHNEPMTQTTPAQPRGVMVVGSGFGRYYAQALADSSTTPLAILAGRGGGPGRKLAAELSVPYAKLDKQEGTPGHLANSVSAAVVAVRSRIVGGDGDDIVAALLGDRIPVLQELPVAPTELAEHFALAHKKDTRYLACGLYEYTDPARRFIAAVTHLRETTKISHVLLRTSHQMLDRASLILAEALGSVPAGRHRITPTSSPEWMLVSGRWGRINVDVVLANRMDPDDPDNHSQPMMTVVVESTDGELSWDGPVSSPRWQQRPHSTSSVLVNPSGEVNRQWLPREESIAIGTWGDVVNYLWPEAVQSAVSMLTDGACSARSVLENERRQLLVLRWWQDITAQLPAPTVIKSQEPTQLTPPEAMQ